MKKSHVCARCKIEKNISNFAIRRTGTPRAYCRECKRIIAKEDRLRWTPEQRMHHNCYKKNYNLQHKEDYKRWVVKSYRKRASEVSDGYVKNLFKDFSLPQSLIDIKKEHVKLVREVKKYRELERVEEDEKHRRDA